MQPGAEVWFGGIQIWPGILRNSYGFTMKNPRISFSVRSSKLVPDDDMMVTGVLAVLIHSYSISKHLLPDPDLILYL